MTKGRKKKKKKEGDFLMLRSRKKSFLAEVSKEGERKGCGHEVQRWFLDRAPGLALCLPVWGQNVYFWSFPASPQKGPGKYSQGKMGHVLNPPCQPG